MEVQDIIIMILELFATGINGHEISKAADSIEVQLVRIDVGTTHFAINNDIVWDLIPT